VSLHVDRGKPIVLVWGVAISASGMVRIFYEMIKRSDVDDASMLSIYRRSVGVSVEARVPWHCMALWWKYDSGYPVVVG